MGIWYGDKRKAKVNICSALSGTGWKIYGYKEDKSDSMTDYYDPASWEGIATKNGFTLVVDVYSNSDSGKQITEYTMDVTTNNNKEKIEKLQAMINDRAATAGEKENAQNMIYKIQAKQKEELEKREQTKKVIDTYPTYKASKDISKNTKWHIEKDGAIVAKGSGIYKFYQLPHEYNCHTMKYEPRKYWGSDEPSKPNEKQQELINQFESYINKLNNLVSKKTTVTDGTQAGEAEALKQQEADKLKKVTVKESKKVWKMIEVNRDYFKVGDYITLPHHGHYWIITDEHMQTATWKGEKKTKKALTYEIVGSQKRGFQRLKSPKRYYDYEFRMLKSLQEGKTKIYKLEQVTEVKEVEKWVKNKPTNNSTATASKTTSKQPDKKTDTQINKNDVTIIEDVDTRDNSPLWVVKFNNKLTREEYKETASKIRGIQGYYSKFKHGFIFRYDPEEKLQEVI